MKKIYQFKLFFVTTFLVYAVVGTAQVGIGTSNPSASAQLEVNSSSRGFLPPRVTLTGTSDISTISSPATGLLVYNTASAGTSPSNVTPGFYYYDGSKWQRIINQQPDATISFNQNTPTTAGVVFTPNTQNSSDYIYVSSTNNSQWTYNGSAYVTYTPPASTPWMLSGGTTDAGSNKSDAVYRTGSVGIGSTTTPNASAQLDVNSTTKGFLPPRMTSTERNAITSPADGLVIYNTTNNRLEIRSSAAWLTLVTLTGTETLTNKTITGLVASTITGGSGTTQTLTYKTTTGVGTTGADHVFQVGNNGATEALRVTNAGRVGIGTNNPGTSLEIASGVSNNSGLKFTNFNSATTTSAGATLGVDASGNVVTVQGSSFSPSFGSSRISGTINVPAGTSSLLTSVILPTTGTYLINYTMRAQNNSYISNQYAVGYLSNSSTPGTPIVGTEILGSFVTYITGNAAILTGGNFSGSYIVTTTAANTSIYFIGSAITGGISFVDDGNGRTQISFVKVTP